MTSSKIPHHLQESLTAYAMQRRETGGFLRAVLENDLFGAVGRADDTNIRLIPNIVSYIYQQLPSGCYGSCEKVADHLAGKA